MAAESISDIAAAHAHLAQQRYTWLVTGAAGFIGSHLVETLLLLGQRVVGLDNFATGKQANLEAVRAVVEERAGPGGWAELHMLEGDITEQAVCRAAMHGPGGPVDFVLHHAALGSVPRSMLDPYSTQQTNVDGTLQLLLAARDAGVRRFVYASSSSVYGDDATQPKREGQEGRPLSPYALSKRMNEDLADLFARTWGLPAVGLRYFNVFGPRQDPNGPYAAVIPRWIAALLAGEPCQIHGDGSTSRDFCYVGNVVQANILAALHALPAAQGQGHAPHLVCNIAVGRRTSLTELHALIRYGLLALAPGLPVGAAEPVYGPFRAGDILHSQADISRAATVLGYAPTHSVADGMQETLAWAVGARALPSVASGRSAQ
jgi:UDP-N-acetylglucosamine 4-epimerase